MKLPKRADQGGNIFILQMQGPDPLFCQQHSFLQGGRQGFVKEPTLA
jgi:hypothetical protein